MKRLMIDSAVIVMCVLALTGGWRVFAAQPRAFTSIAGTWTMHGGVLSISPAGQGIAHFRTYQSCGQSITTNCDQIIRNGIYAGGYVAFTLNRLAGNKAFGSVTGSGWSWMIGTTITIARNANDTVTVYALKGFGRYCGPATPAGTCGA